MYAIGPSLHDWEREKWEEQEMASDLREKACKKDFYWWEINTYCDRQKKEGQKEIDEKMECALDKIFTDERSAAKFQRLLFDFYCSNDHANKLRDMLGEYIFSAYSQHWDWP